MSLLEAHNYDAVFGTPEGDTYRVPLVCWREDGENVIGMAMIKGHLRRADAIPGFMRYGPRDDNDDGDGSPFGPPAADSRPDPKRTAALR